MKILHINCNYIGTALHQVMIEHLDEKEVESDIFCPTYNPNTAIITPNKNVCVAKCFNKWDRICFGYKQQKIIKRIQMEYNIASFDCIHAYTLFTDGNTAMMLSKKYGVPFIVAIRDTDINDFLRLKPYLKNRAVQIMKNAQAVLFLSPAYKRIVMERYVPESCKEEIEKKSHIIPNGIDDFWHKNICGDNANERKSRILSRNIRVVFAGRINGRKNLVTTQKALQLLRERGWHIQFSFAGGIEDQKTYDKIMKYPNTTYCGKMNKSQLLTLYREGDVFVMPSHTETFGLVYAEAMSQGLPVIYTKGQGFDGQFPDGLIGFAVNDSDELDVANAIERIANNYDFIQGNTTASIAKFSWDDICEEYIAIYRDISQVSKGT